ncbi:MAG: fluoride efflux transporter CrcB [Solirubrobacterales bacterium]
MSPSTWIALGALGGVAAIARFILDAAISERGGGPFPLGTLAVNLSGAAVLGLLAGAALSGNARIIVVGGGLGSYTTFSTWMFESQRLGETGRLALLWGNLGLSLGAGLAALSIGHLIGGAL